jgi:hypothetical protein
VLGPLEIITSSLDPGQLLLLNPIEKQSSSPHQRMETDPASETFFLLVFKIPDDGQSTETQ